MLLQIHDMKMVRQTYIKEQQWMFMTYGVISFWSLHQFTGSIFLQAETTICTLGFHQWASIEPNMPKSFPLNYSLTHDCRTQNQSHKDGNTKYQGVKWSRLSLDMRGRSWSWSTIVGISPHTWGPLMIGLHNKTKKLFWEKFRRPKDQGGWTISWQDSVWFSGTNQDGDGQTVEDDWRILSDWSFM